MNAARSHTNEKTTRTPDALSEKKNRPTTKMPSHLFSSFKLQKTTLATNKEKTPRLGLLGGDRDGSGTQSLQKTKSVLVTPVHSRTTRETRAYPPTGSKIDSFLTRSTNIDRRITPQTKQHPTGPLEFTETVSGFRDHSSSGPGSVRKPLPPLPPPPLPLFPGLDIPKDLRSTPIPDCLPSAALSQEIGNTKKNTTSNGNPVQAEKKDAAVRSPEVVPAGAEQKTKIREIFIDDEFFSPIMITNSIWTKFLDYSVRLAEDEMAYMAGLEVARYRIYYPGLALPQGDVAALWAKKGITKSHVHVLVSEKEYVNGLHLDSLRKRDRSDDVYAFRTEEMKIIRVPQYILEALFSSVDVKTVNRNNVVERGGRYLSAIPIPLFWQKLERIGEKTAEYKWNVTSASDSTSPHATFTGAFEGGCVCVGSELVSFCFVCRV